HDPAAGGRSAAQRTQALRAFRRTLTLDPGYALAYSHVIYMLEAASRERPWLALLPGDSLEPARGPDFASLLDSGIVAAAVERARTELTAQARNWVAAQPTTSSAHAALVDAYVESAQPTAALAEVDRYAAPSAPSPERPSVEPTIRFTAGEDDRAAADVRRALDTLSADDLASLDAGPDAASSAPGAPTTLP